jgi:hypothetical protein
MTTTPEDGWRRDRPWLAGLPDKLPEPAPRPVPELGWCARCQRVNPRPGYPEDHDGHDWVCGLDQYAYIAGVICPDCITPDEAMAVLDYRVFGTGDVSLDGGIFIDPADKWDDDDL